MASVRLPVPVGGGGRYPAGSTGSTRRSKRFKCVYVYLCFFFLSIISLRTCTFSPRAPGVDPYQQRGHFARGLSAIRAVCRAWQAFEVSILFFFGGGG